MFYSVALIAYIIDFIFAEFPQIKFKHPISLMGDYIKWFENKFYKDSIFQGALLAISLIFMVGIIGYVISFIDNVFVLGLIASFTISHNMLYSSVKEVLQNSSIEEKRQKISMLVSRDTKSLNNSEINKASIETYAENLSDGVIAPLFYLVLFGVGATFIYKAINTLDSMVGYRTNKYEKFGKFSARLDDMVNFIPSRITAVLIAILFKSKKAFCCFYYYGEKHNSLNAGFPISAMALSLGIKLGGNTSYFGKIQSKPYFGDGKIDITNSDVQNALRLKKKLDILIMILLFLGVYL